MRLAKAVSEGKPNPPESASMNMMFIERAWIILVIWALSIDKHVHMVYRGDLFNQ